MKKRNHQKRKSILFQFKSIRTTLLFSFSVLIVSALLTFLLFSMNHVQRTVLDNSVEYTKQLMNQVNVDIDSYISYMENIAQIIVNDGDVKEYLFTSDASGKTEVKNKIMNQFTTLKDTRSDIYNIGVISLNGRYLLNESEDELNPFAKLESLEWYQDIIDGKRETILTASHIQNVIKDDYQWVVTLSQGIVNPENGKIEGVFFVDLNYSSISDLCDRLSLGSKGYTFIVDNSGFIIYHPKQQLLYSGIKTELINQVLEQESGSFLTADKELLYTVSKSDKTGWFVAGVANYEEMMGRLDETQLIYAILSLVLLAAAILISIVLSNEITKPIKMLGKSMKVVETGNFNQVTFEVEYQNEIGHLTKSFQIMVTKIQNLIKQNMEEQETKRKSELRALQAQINPHFLYNTLDSIIWMAESGKNREVVQMTSSLSKLLRKSISNEKEIVTIESEIGYTKEYLTIQKMRYQDKLEYDISVAPEILQKTIVKLVLQPLVENAIYHGIKYEDRKGMLRITGEIAGDAICIQVIDNGRGMEKETLQHILDPKEDGEKRAVGVANVHNRIQMHYGKEYGLAYKSQIGVGTTVTVTLPIRSREV